MDAQVNGTGHDVVRIGYYDPQMGKLVNHRSPLFFSHVMGFRLFDDLPECLIICCRPMHFRIRTARHKGTEFTFRSNRLGIFLITATWSLRNRNEVISSNPVVLAVKPPVDTNGRPVVKPEWLWDERYGPIWEHHLEEQDKR